MYIGFQKIMMKYVNSRKQTKSLYSLKKKRGIFSCTLTDSATDKYEKLYIINDFL